jgi:transcriptional regulatory protein LevR
MKALTKIKIENFLKNLSTEIDILNYISVEDIDIYKPYYSINDMLIENGGFNIEIIYYSEAINYLKENDFSLKLSLEIAEDFGYTIKDINSELLASLLASENAATKFQDLKNEIEDFFIDIVKLEN